MGLGKLFGKSKQKQKSKGYAQEPDTPIPFGMKISWLAIKEKDPKIVMEKLHCTDGQVSNWESAFSQMQKGKEVFVTPCLNGYVLVLNYDALKEYWKTSHHNLKKFSSLPHKESWIYPVG